MKSSTQFKTYQERLVYDIAEMVCRPCTDPRKSTHDLNFDNPLACGCRCATVERLLKRLERPKSD